MNNNCKLTNLDYTNCLFFADGSYSCKVDHPKPAETKSSFFMETFTAPGPSPIPSVPKHNPPIKMHK